MRTECVSNLKVRLKLYVIIYCKILLYNLFSESVDIYFGALNIYNANEEGQARLTVTPKNIVVHKDYNNTGVENDDIALIKLPFQMIFNAYIQAAKLPDRSNDYTNATILASGWGIVDGWSIYYLCKPIPRILILKFVLQL